LSLKGYVEVDQLVFEDVGQAVRVGDYTFYQLTVELQAHFVDNRSEGIGKQLDNLFSRVLAVIDEHMGAFALFGASQNEIFGAAVTNTDSVHS
jgi:hypothetical protein